LAQVVVTVAVLTPELPLLDLAALVVVALGVLLLDDDVLLLAVAVQVGVAQVVVLVEVQ